MEHPSEETLKRFVAGTASREEGRQVVAHLLKGCAPCARILKALMQPDATSREAYESALQRFDGGLVDALESSISPMQTLRTVLGLKPGGGGHRLGPKPPRREES